MPLAIVAILAVLVAATNAEVIETSEAGFLVKSEAQIAETPLEVFRALTGRIDQWWNPECMR